VNPVANVAITGPTNTAGCTWEQTWTATYTDACNNAAAPVSITYTWTEDLIAPVIATTATSGNLGCNPQIVAPTFTVNDNCDVNPVANVAITGPTNTAGCTWEQTWTATYTDACNNAAAPVSITYTWTEDLIAPVIATTATSGNLGCNPQIVAPTFTVTDNCDVNPVANVAITGPTNTAGCTWEQTWTATYTDACNNAAAPVSITYTWTEDLIAPVIATTATSGNLGCNPQIVAPTFTVNDNCDVNPVANVAITGPTNTAGCTWEQTWTATYTDACNNAAAPVSITYTWTEDLIAPVIATTATSGNLGCNPTITPPVFTGLDNCDGVFTPVVTTAGPATTNGCDFTQTWEANYTDACLNDAIPVSITYTWTEDTQLPVISTTATSGALGCNPTITPPVFTGLDNCDGVFTPVVTTAGPATTNGCDFTQTWEANYTDACLNDAIPVSITYTWTEDTQLPVISTTATSGALGCNPTITPPVFTGLDNCDGVFTPVVTTAGPATTNGCDFTQTWEANYTDACLNDAIPVSITYTWTEDTQLPVISTTATSGALGCNPTITPPVFTGLDNCDGVFTPVVTTAGPATTNGCDFTQTWEANYTDACLNDAIPVSITYTWTEDTQLPVISTTATSGALGCNPTITPPVFTGLDNCDGVFTPVVTTAGPATTNGCDFTQTWEANYTDACLNDAIPVSITYTWTEDTQLPVISTTATSGALGCNPTITPPVFTGLDNCDGVFTPVVTTAGPATTNGCDFTQTWEANYTDACLNDAIPVSITYTWTEDTQLPVISTTATSGALGCNPTITPPVFTGLDNCDGRIHPRRNDSRTCDNQRMRLHSDMGGQLHRRLPQ
jgi:hypothetical protein